MILKSAGTDIVNDFFFLKRNFFLVENHPEVMNTGAEKGGPLMEAKVEGKPEEPKTEAKPEEAKTEDKAAAPEPKPTLDQKLDTALTREEDKPTEKPKAAPLTPVNGPDWYGNPLKVPQQRGGPDESGSIGLGANESITDTIQANISESRLLVFLNFMKMEK